MGDDFFTRWRRAQEVFAGSLTQDRAYAIRDVIMRQIPGWLAVPGITWGDGYIVDVYTPGQTSHALIQSEEKWQEFRQAYQQAAGKELVE